MRRGSNGKERAVEKLCSGMSMGLRMLQVRSEDLTGKRIARHYLFGGVQPGEGTPNIEARPDPFNER